MFSRLALMVALVGACAARQAPKDISEAPVELRVPAPQDFVFGPGDTLNVKVWRQDDFDLEVTIAPDGTLSLPLVGRIRAAGLNYPDLLATIEDGLSEYLVDPAVAVNIVEVSSQKVFVLGEVENPAVLQVDGDLSILEALTRTGGINVDARTDNVLLVRGGLDTPELFLVDVEAIYGRGDFSQMVYLQRGDIVVVPAKTIVNVERFFRRISGMLAPFVAGSAIYRNAISGGAQGTSVLIQ
ncbi:MAG: polysaccharide biosynthesis/export family protein [Alphaproteobacteria bacterium]|nr:polysaccharide biosynthesis/export family protein [Alphaproteobacteria bacterium]